MKKILVGLLVLGSISVYAQVDEAIKNQCSQFIGEAINQSLVCNLQRHRIEAYGQSSNAGPNSLRNCTHEAVQKCVNSQIQSDVPAAIKFVHDRFSDSYVCNLQKNILINVERGDVQGIKLALNDLNNCSSKAHDFYERYMNTIH
ncbi:MAG: hypothetical protein ACOVP4_12730 [Bacteriovoracaceae bacterium]